MIFWLLAAGLVSSLLVVGFWETLRDTVYRWAQAHHYRHLAKVVLRLDTIISRGLYRMQTLANRKQHGKLTVVEDKVVKLDELPDDVRARMLALHHGPGDTIKMDVSQHVLVH